MKAYLIDFENVKSKGLTGIELLSPEDKVIIFYSENSDTISFEMHRKVMTSVADIEYLKVRVGGKNALDFQLSTLLGYLLAKELYSHIFIISGDKGFDKLHDFWNVSYADKNSVTVFRTQTLAAAVAFARTSARKQAAAPVAEEAAPEIEAPKLTAAPVPEKIEAELPAEPAPAEETAELIEAIDVPAVEVPAPEPEAQPVKAKKTEKSSHRRGRKPQSAKELIHNALLGIVDLSDEETDVVISCASEAEDKEDFHNALAKIFKAHATEIYKVLRPKYLKIKEALEQETVQAEPAPQPEAEAVPEAEIQEPVPEVKPEADEKPHLDDSELFDMFTRELAAANTKPEEPGQPEETDKAPEPEENNTKKTAEKKKPSEKKRTGRRKAKKSQLVKELEKLLADNCSEEEIATVCRLFEETDTKQKLYLSIVKKYKKDRGCEIYKLIRSEYNALASFKQSAGQEA